MAGILAWSCETVPEWVSFSGASWREVTQEKAEMLMNSCSGMSGGSRDKDTAQQWRPILQGAQGHGCLLQRSEEW